MTYYYDGGEEADDDQQGGGDRLPAQQRVPDGVVVTEEALAERLHEDLEVGDDQAN